MIPWNIHLWISPIKCWQAECTNGRWPACMTTELWPTSCAAMSPEELGLGQELPTFFSFSPPSNSEPHRESQIRFPHQLG